MKTTWFKMLTIFIAFVLSGLILIIFVIEIREKSRRIQCKENLSQIAKAIRIYVVDFGDKKWYPDTNGGGFLVRPFQMGIIKNPQVYVCPSTTDHTNGKTLLSVVAEDSDKTNGTSYAGRKNANQEIYPGLFKLEYYTLTPIGSDDWQGSPNHDNGKYINIILRGGAIYPIHVPEVDGNNYDFFARYNFHNQPNIADPLTN